MASITNIELYTTKVLEVVNTWKKIYEEDEIWIFYNDCGGNSWTRVLIEDKIIDIVTEGVRVEILNGILENVQELNYKLMTCDNAEFCRNIQELIDILNTMKNMKERE